MNNITSMLTLGCVGVISLAASAQDTVKLKPNADTTVQYFSRLAGSNQHDKELLQTKLYSLLKSEKEQDWLLAQRFFYQLKKTAVSDSVLKAIEIKFPEGTVVRNKAVQVIYETEGAEQKEKA